MISANDASDSAAISFSIGNTFASWSGLFDSHEICGSRAILAPLAPPLRSDSRNENALHHAVSIISLFVNPDFKIRLFALSTSKVLP